MSVEIERKFLLRDAGDTRWKALGQGSVLRQAYLSSDPARTVRVRIRGQHATLTIKGKTTGATRGEWEYPLPLADAEAMLEQLCLRPFIDKIRYEIPYAGMLWEVDEFFGENAGLVVAEIELTAEDQAFEKPDWIGEEVTGDARYFNANLLQHPYQRW